MRSSLAKSTFACLVTALCVVFVSAAWAQPALVVHHNLAVTIDPATHRLQARDRIRVPGAPGDNSGGKDICTRPGINIGSTDPLTNAVLGQDFVFAELNTSQAASKAKAIQIAEERTLNLPEDQVDAKSTSPTVVVNGGFGSEDQASFTVTLFTFPIPALSLIRPILPILPSPILP